MNEAVKIIVVGSINMDIVIRTPHLPVPGETVLAEEDYQTHPGGKGANQAVAAAKLGAETTFIGAVGADAFGDALIENLAAHGVNTDVMIRKESASGVALIAIEEAAKENTIIVSGGANRQLSSDDIRSAENAIKAADILVCQLEIPLETVEAALQIAKRHDVTTILNAAPMCELSNDLLALVDVLIVNETEAMQLSSYPITELEDIEQASAILMGRGIGSIVLTMGGKGAHVVDKIHRIYVPAFPVKVFDTVGAGDAFVGAYAVAIAQGRSLADALTFSNAVGALATTKSGAQSGSPTAKEVEAFLKRFRNKDFV